MNDCKLILPAICGECVKSSVNTDLLQANSARMLPETVSESMTGRERLDKMARHEVFLARFGKKGHERDCQHRKRLHHPGLMRPCFRTANSLLQCWRANTTHFDALSPPHPTIQLASRTFRSTSRSNAQAYPEFSLI